MSDSDYEPDENTATIDDADIASVETAIESLLNKTQNLLQYPYEPSDSTSTGTPSAALDYRLSADIVVTLDTTWPLFAGLTLTNITLRHVLTKARMIRVFSERISRGISLLTSYTANLYISISASATIGSTNFRVSGTIPRLSSGKTINFLLMLEVDGTLQSVVPGDLVSDLTNGGYQITSVTTKLDTEVANQLENNNGGSSFASGAGLLISRPPNGTFFLRQVGVSFDSDISWTIVPEHLELSHVSIGMLFSHDSASSPWQAYISLDGIVAIEDIELSVSGEINIGDISSLKLEIAARERSGTSPSALLDRFLDPGSSTQIDTKLQLPDGVTIPDSTENPFDASLLLLKDSSGWYMSQLDAKLFWQETFWRPVTAVDISLTQLYFQFNANRGIKQDSESPSATPLVYSGTFGGSVSLYGLPLSVVVTYQSATPPATSLTVLTCVIEDGAYVSLQDIASDSLLNPAGATSGHDLYGQAVLAQTPDSVPVDLTLCSSRVWGSQRECVLCFGGLTLSRLQLKACYELDWQITTQLTVTGMGLFFDITNPTSQDKTATSMKGYAYGQIVLANGITVFAFVAGVSNPSASQFRLGLSASYDPTAPLGKSPQQIIGDTKMIGTLVPDTDWSLPDSSPPTASVQDTLTSLNAQLSMQIIQMPDPEAVDQYLTTIASIIISLNVSGSWRIFDTVDLNQVALNVVAVPGNASKALETSYYGQLLGLVSADLTTVSGTRYTVVLNARIERSPQQPLLFSATISVSYPGETDAGVTLSTFFKMPLSGLDQVNVTDNANTQNVPTDLSAKPQDVLNEPVAECSLVVSKASGAWVLEKIAAQFRQSETWEIIPDKMSVTKSMLSLIITNPRQAAVRKIQFAAQTTLTIGSQIDITAGVAVSGTGNDGILTIVISVGRFQEIATTLVGTPLIPDGCSAFDSGYTFVLTITCTKDGNGQYQLASMSVNATAMPETPWVLGPLSIQKLSLIASISAINTTSRKSSIVFYGEAAISGNPVSLNITFTDTPQLDIAISAGNPNPVQATDVAALFLTGGLSPSNNLEPPSITADTGLNDYATRKTNNITLTFKRNTSWYADSLSLNIDSGDRQWDLVSPVLYAHDLSLSLILSGLSASTKQLTVNLGLMFGFRLRDGSGTGEVPCTAVATSKNLMINVDMTQCSLPQFLYVATAGYWNPPDALDLQAITPDLLILDFDWDDGKGTFRAICPDWNLTESLPKLAGMKSPSLVAEVKRTGSGFEATGSLKGDAMLIGVTIPIEYVLVTGPFLVFGIDIKEAYKMAKRLWKAFEELGQILETAEEIGSIMAELAELMGVAGVAGEFFAALEAGGFAKDILNAAIDACFSKHGGSGSSGGGGGGSSSDPAQDDPSKNGDDDPDKPSQMTEPILILSGGVLSPGPGGGATDLVVYPKDKYGNFLQPFDPSLLEVTQYTDPNSLEEQTIPSSFERIANGYQSSITRPFAACTLSVTYPGQPALSAQCAVMIQAQESVFSLSNSVINRPSTIGCLLPGLVELLPRDQYNEPRYGRNAAPLLRVNFMNLGSGAEPLYDADHGFVLRNDRLLLPFSLPEAGEYCLSIFEGPNDTVTPSKVDILGVNRLDSKKCTASGDGLCSGILGEQVSVMIELMDQSGAPYVPNLQDPEYLDLSIIMASDAGAQQANIPFSIHADKVSAYYQRPTTASLYSIMIYIGTDLLENAPFDLQSLALPPTISIENSRFEIWGPHEKDLLPEATIAVGDQVKGKVTTYDSNGGIWSLPESDGSPRFQVLWPNGFTFASLSDDGDGSYSFQATAYPQIANSDTNPFEISVTAANDVSKNVSGSPLSFNVKPARRLNSITAYGSGLLQCQGQESMIRVWGKDQYTATYDIDLGTNCKILVVHDGVAVPLIGASTRDALTYQQPAANPVPILVVIRPLNPLNLSSDLLFKECMYLVPSGDPTFSDPSKGFLLWNVLSQMGISVATLYAVDQNGNRRFQGGDLIQATSIADAAVTVFLSIVDNLDGSYTLDFVLPPSALTPPSHMATTPPSGFEVSINGLPLGTSPFRFPLNYAALSSIKVSGAGLSTATRGSQATFTIACLDSSGALTTGDFYSASAYLLQTGTDTPRFVSCDIRPMVGGQLVVTYTVPITLDTGTYNCHIFVNTEPVASSPTQVVVLKEDPLDDIDQAWKVTNWQCNWDPDPKDWKIENDVGWMMSVQQPNHTSLRAPKKSESNGLNWSYVLQLPQDDALLQGGFLFSFDLAVECTGSVGFKPYFPPDYLPQNGMISADWKGNGGATDSGSLRWSQSQGVGPTGTGGIFRLLDRVQDRLDVNATSPSSISFFYLPSTAWKAYSLYVFQAGQFICQYTWPFATDPPTWPFLGFSILLEDDSQPQIDISNITTVPTHFRPNPATVTISPTELPFSAPWISKFASNENELGRFTPQGLVVSGSDPARRSALHFTQPPTSTFGYRITVYEFTVHTYHDYGPQTNDKPDRPLLIGGISFEGFIWAAGTGRWVDQDSISTSLDLGEANIVIGGGELNTVVVLAGQKCVTVYSNGAFAFTQTRRGGQAIDGYESDARLVFRWTDAVLLSMRAWPGLTLR